MTGGSEGVKSNGNATTFASERAAGPAWDAVLQGVVVAWGGVQWRKLVSSPRNARVKVIVWCALVVVALITVPYNLGILVHRGWDASSCIAGLSGTVCLLAGVATWRTPHFVKYTGHVIFGAVFIGIGSIIAARISMDEYAGSAVGPLPAASITIMIPSLAGVVFNSKGSVVFYLVCSIALMWTSLALLGSEHRDMDGMRILAKVNTTVNVVLAGCMLYVHSMRDALLRQNLAAATQVREARALATVEQKASAAKTRFVAVVSHEIRNPLTGMILCTDMLSTERDLSPRAAKCVSGLGRATKHLLSIANGILDVTKIETGNIALEKVPFDLLSVCEDTIQACAPEAARKQVELVLSIGPAVPAAVAGDPTRLRQVLHNFVSNAVKFVTEPGGEVEVSVVCEPCTAHHTGEDVAASHRYRFKVRDTGIGISQAGIEKLFQEFSQADVSIERQFGGTGLGLFICKELTELMGGSVGVESEQGVGTTFSFDVVLGSSDTDDVALDPVPRLCATDYSQWQFHVTIVLFNDALRRHVAAIVSRFLEDADAVITTYDTPSRAARVLRAKLAATRSEGTTVRHLVVFSAEATSDPLLKVCAEYSSEVQAAMLVYADTTRERNLLQRRGGAVQLMQRPVLPKGMCDMLAVMIDKFQEHLDPETGSPTRVTERRPKRDPARAGRVTRVGDTLERAPVVLIVDDLHLLRKYVSKVLEELGYRTMVAASGIEAVAIVKQYHHELACVLMDCEMPLFDGFDATKSIRGFEVEKGIGKRQRLPICGISGNAMWDDVIKSTRSAGVDDFLFKPLQGSTLEKTLEHWVAFRCGVDCSPTCQASQEVDGRSNSALSGRIDTSARRRKRVKAARVRKRSAPASLTTIESVWTGVSRDPGDDNRCPGMERRASVASFN